MTDSAQPKDAAQNAAQDKGQDQSDASARLKMPDRAQLGKPEPLAADTLRIVALGGLGEVGRNMTAFEINGQILIVDCGVLFPERTQPGVDVILPDFKYILKRLDDVVGLVLTHGHEDHIGAVPYLLRKREDIPIYGASLTLALVGAKLREHHLTPVTTEVTAGEHVTIGEFDIDFINVSHSIPDAMALHMTTKAGTLIHTGDFKMDQLPLDGRITDLNSMARFGDAGVDLLLVDSTNAEVPGFVTPERNIGPTLESIFDRAPGRLIVSCFASNVHRVQQIVDAAVSHGRKVAFFGRSMVRTMNLARDLGYLKIPGGTLIASDHMDEYPDDQVVLVCTGSQGEPRAALARMANGDHKIQLGEGDTVVMASSMIPGNESSIYSLINGLIRTGANIVHKGNALVHVSGHAAAGELIYLFNVIKPRNVMPVHGEVRHQLANGALAVQTGVEPERIVLADDGTVIDLVNGDATIVGQVSCEHVFVDGSSIGELDESQLQERMTLSEDGFISIYVTVDTKAKTIVTGPTIRAKGFAESDDVFDDILPLIADRVEEALGDSVTDPYQLQQVIRRNIGRWVNKKHHQRPMIVPVVDVV